LGSLSPPSKDIQATQGKFGEGPPVTLSCWIQAANKVVLPKPAGAEIRVNFRVRLAFKVSIRCWRVTRAGRGLGM